jgi:hypothetical protein
VGDMDKFETIEFEFLVALKTWKRYKQERRHPMANATNQEKPKNLYLKPCLTVYGDISALTKGTASVTNSDSGKSSNKTQ